MPLYLRFWGCDSYLAYSAQFTFLISPLLASSACIPNAARIGCQIGVFDNPIVHRVRNAHHIAQVDVDIHIDLVDDPFIVLLDHVLRGSGKAQV